MISIDQIILQTLDGGQPKQEHCRTRRIKYYSNCDADRLAQARQTIPTPETIAARQTIPMGVK